MVSPFKKPANGESRQTLWQRLTQVTRHEVEESDAILGEARAFLEWDSMPYMIAYREWLTRQAMAPASMTDQHSMVASVARSNAYKEMLEHLRVKGANAHSTLGE